MQEKYTFPVVKKILKKFKFKNFEARKEMKEAIELIYVSYSGEEDQLHEIISKIRHASLLEEGVEE